MTTNQEEKCHTCQMPVSNPPIMFKDGYCHSPHPQEQGWEKEFWRRFGEDFMENRANISVESIKSFIQSLIEKEREGVREKLKGQIMSAVDFSMYVAKANNWDVDQREKYAKEVETKILALLDIDKGKE